MKRVSDITNGLDPQQALAQIPAAQPIKVDKQTADIVNTVFDKLQGIFPAWRQAWTDDKALYNAKREWIAGFIQGGINSDAQLAFGFQQARKSTSPFLPNVGQFVAWCNAPPEVMGLPCEAQAWDEARAGKYSHPAVRIAAEATSTFDLHGGSNNDKALRQRFERNYAIVMRRAQTGQPLEGRIAKGIGHDSMRPREQVQLEYSRQEADRIVDILEIPKDPKACRAQLLATLGIRRDKHA
ncbi:MULTISPECIES: replication protein P [Pseudomonas]|uniref:replication protein P n=1 Tax=Pseudomonas TaxID=286 RepID=UPI001C654A49|nr:MULTISPECIES: replication protein P [unclassified Pseudomonas]MBW8127508.1 Replication protein P [Pseudomonas sp. LAP_36]MBW8139284.1 Replication protein P [Pseudomonas sp. PAMC 26818]